MYPHLPGDDGLAQSLGLGHPDRDPVPLVAPDRSADSILRELRERLDPLFLPRRVVLVPSLPRNALGKLPREALLRMVSQDDFPPGWLSTGRPTVRN